MRDRYYPGQGPKMPNPEARKPDTATYYKRRMEDAWAAMPVMSARSLRTFISCGTYHSIKFPNGKIIFKDGNGQPATA